MSIIKDTARELDELAERRWKQQLQKTRAGDPKGNLANIVTAMEEAPELSGIVAFDEFSRRIMLAKAPPWANGDFFSRPWKDADDGELLTWLQCDGIPATATGTVADAVRMVAERHAFDALADYLNGLEWDGRKRLDFWLILYLGADDTQLNSAIGRAWAISAVARGLDPGCQADHVLVLEGPQGTGKSQAARILGGDYIQEHLPDFHSKDAATALNGSWIVELSELAALTRSEVEAVKSYITRRVDKFRPAYGRHLVEQPRRSVFIATTNETRYLRDSTNRRFWPVRIGKVELARLKRDRDQIWAETVAAYRNGEPWHFTSADTLRQIEAEQAARVEDDPWAGTIARFLQGREETTTDAILDHLELSTDKQHAGHAKRVSTIMRRFGWIDCETRAGGKRRVVWRPEP